MPKPTGKTFYNNKTWKNQYNDRNDHRGDQRRVSFKTNKFRKGGLKEWALEAHLEDEDVDMGQMGSSQGKFSNKKFNRKGGKRTSSPVPYKGSNMKRKLIESPSGWYRVMLPHGNKYDKEFIYKVLIEKANPYPFMPLGWKTAGPTISFYLDDFNAASNINDADREVSCPDGFKLLLRVTSSICPNIDINNDVKEKIKLTMAKRYNAVTKALDLTRFHADPNLVEYFCALSRFYVLTTVIDIAADNIPELEALNLAENKLHIFNHLKKLKTKLPNLKILYMGKNKIREMSALDPLIGLPLVELVLADNPVCGRFKEQSVYDGIDLPPPISFDVAEETPLPKSQQTFLCNEEAKGIVRQFLEQYFAMFDNDNREPLLQAYHESACLSMTSAYPYSQQNQKNTSWLNWYNTDNRNLYRVQDLERRYKLLKQGHLSIVAFLQDMPSTKHDMNNFTVDLTLFTPQMLLLSCSGIFRELKSGHKYPPLRAFFRTFVIVPAGSGFCIANEAIHITNATEDQATVAFKAPIPDVAVTTSIPTPSIAAPVIDDSTKQQMIQAMSQQSGMNLEWSRRCLEESNWDFQKAGLAFTVVQKRGGIPSEAFVK